MANGKLNFTQKEYDKLLKDIHSQKVHLFNLPENLYNATGAELTEGVFDGYGVPKGADISAPAFNKVRALKKSVYQFAAAKQFQFISDMQNFLFDDKGIVRPFKEFKEFADVININYNKNWLQAEYLTSIAMSGAAADWEQIQEDKDIFPYLKYETKEDPRVRSEHAAMSGILKHVDDPFWDSHFPPNGWRCRCQAIPREGGRETDLSKKNLPAVDPVFSGNAGKSGQVFNKKHPYNSVPKEFKKHKENNFGLPFPDDVKTPKKKK